MHAAGHAVPHFVRPDARANRAVWENYTNQWAGLDLQSERYYPLAPRRSICWGTSSGTTVPTRGRKPFSPIACPITAAIPVLKSDTTTGCAGVRHGIGAGQQSGLSPVRDHLEPAGAGPQRGADFGFGHSTRGGSLPPPASGGQCRGAVVGDGRPQWRHFGDGLLADLQSDYSQNDRRA